MRASSCARARSALALPILWSVVLALFVLTRPSVLARPQSHTNLASKDGSAAHARGLALAIDLGEVASPPLPRSPRPTPAVPVGGLARVRETYKSVKLPAGVISKRQSGSCLDSSTTVAQINALFQAGGANAGVLQFCPGATISVDATIYFSASGQGLQTLGGSAVAPDQRATFKVVSSKISTVAESSNCVGCNDLLIDSLIIDGGRAELGSLDSTGLLELGGSNARHTVTNNKLTQTRGWTSLHFIEGYKLDCTGAVIKNNVIGPSGEAYGVGKIADGISLSCANSVIQGNTVFDATDGAIVLFSSPGTDVSGNKLLTSTQSTLGAINMVDYAPWSGDYTGVKVHDNQITADGALLKIGIAQGPACWGDDVTDFNFGAQVYGNSFSGPDIAFGLAVAGVRDWTVRDNSVASSAKFRGAKTGNCHGLGATVQPTFAIVDPAKNPSGLNLGSQANCWTQGTFQYLLCYVADTSTAGTGPNPAFVSGGTCTAPAPPAAGTSDWVDSGYCLKDSPTRILVGEFIQTQANTIEYCTSRCTSLQYYYAGLENGNQCYCSNKIATGAGYGTVRASSTCTIPCAANSGELCGGSDYGLKLMYDRSRVAAPVAPFDGSTTASTTSSSPSSTTSSRFSSTSSTTASSTTSSSTVSTTASSTTSSRFATSISSTSTSSSRSTTASSSASAVPSTSPAYANGFTGPTCVEDNESRVLSGYNFESDAMTINLCTSTCQSKGFRYAGIEYAKQCWCGSTLASSTVLDSSRCSMGCSGDASSKCGGSYAMSLYQSSSPVVTTSSSVPSSTTASSSAPAPSASGWSSSATCYSDAASPYRVLDGISMESSSLTPKSCQTFCKDYKYAGVEYSKQCMCGNTIKVSNGAGNPSTSCTMPCAGDKNQICGGSYAAGIYTKSDPPAKAWSATQCVVDDGQRLLPDYSFDDPQMTNQLCQSRCQRLNYKYAGTQWYDQCTCANALSTSSTRNAGKSAPASDCNTPCRGDSTQVCGGSYRISLSTFA